MIHQTDTQTILIVDDTPSNLSVVVSLFEGRGYHVAIAQDGEEGLQRAQLVLPDLILLDVMLPGADGFEICRRLKAQENTRDIPVIFMTSLASTEHKVKGFAAGGVDYVTKPLQIDEVMARAETHLKLHAAQRQLEAQNAQLEIHSEELERRVAERTAELAESNMQLSKREQQFRTLAENLPDYIVRYDRECRVTYFNPSVGLNLAREFQPVLGMAIDESHPGIESMLIYRRILEQVMATGEVGEVEIDVQHIDGQMYTHHVRLVAERSKEGNIVGGLAIGRDITERNAHVRELQRWHDIFEHAEWGVVIGGADGLLELMNPAFAQMHGYTVEELTGRPILDVYAPEYREGLAEHIRLAHQNRVHSFESWHLRKDGTTFPVFVDITTVYGSNGQVMHRIVNVQDITERKRMQEELHSREQMFRALAENSPNPIYRYDRECRRLYVNPVVGKILGKSVDELIGSTPADGAILISEQNRKLMQAIRQVFGCGETMHIDIDFIGRDGRHREFDMLLVPERDVEGEVNTVLALAHDITAIRKVERRLTRFMANVPGFVYTFRQSPEGDLSFPFTSPGIHDMYGLYPEDVRDDITPLHALTHPEDQSRVLNTIAESARSMTPFQVEFRMQRPGHGQRWIEARSVPERDTDGGILWHGVMLDITERKMAEKSLRESEEKYRTLIQKIQAAVVVHGADTKIITTNTAAQEILGLSEEQLYGKRAIDPEWHFSREDGSPMPLDEYPVNIVLASQKNLRNYVVRVHRPNKENDVWVLVNADPLFDRQGEISQIIVTFIDITERKRTEEALRESEQRFRGIFDNVSDTLYLLEVTEEGRFRNIEVNPAFEKSSGIPRAELIGKFIEETVPEETARIVIEKYRRCIDAGHPIDEEVSLELPTGTRHFHSTLIPVRDDSGRISRIVGISRDITERKQAEQQLFMMDFALNHVREAVYLFRAPKYLVYVNEEACRELGYSREELLGMTLFDIDPDADLEELKELDNVTHRQGYHIFERRHRTKDGRILPVEILSTPFEYEGQLMSIALARDITERKAMEAALLDREQQFRTLAENAPDIIMRYDRECRRIYVNPAFEREIGFSKEQALNVTPDTQWPSNVTMPVEEYQSHLRDVMETGETKLIVVGWPGRDEKGLSIQYYDVRIVAEFDSKSRVIGALAMGHNITELKEAEKHLEATQAELRELDDRREMTREEERRRISRELHDELGQLLTAIRMEISVIKLQYELEDSQFQEKMQRIVSLVDRTIRGVRDVASMLRPAMLEMGIVAALEWFVDEFSARTGISCTLQVPEEKIDLDEKSAIAIFRIVQESLTNVARHAEASEVNILLKKREDGIWLKISDNGQGFDPEMKKKKSLGLVGVRERVFMLGGDVKITSASGKGTALEIYLPHAGNSAEKFEYKG